MSTRKILTRELSWLSFNERVLQEAENKSVPLAERIKFLGIFSNNLDEFFKVRVASIKRMIDLGMGSKRYEGSRPKNVLSDIQAKVMEMQTKFSAIFKDIKDELAKENILIVDEKYIQNEPLLSEFVERFFSDKVLPFLTPIMLSNIDNFPELKDKSIYLATKLSGGRHNDKPIYSLIEIPTAVMDRFIVLPSIGDKKFIMLVDDVIRYSLKNIFAIFNYEHHEAYTIKITRDAELDIDNDLSQSFLEKIEKGVSNRKKGEPVRFVYDRDIAQDLLELIIEGLELDNEDNLIPGGRYHNFKDFMAFPNIAGKHIEYPPTPPNPHFLLEKNPSTMEILQQRDILLHFPYQKFSHFVSLLREAAIDPKVTEIYITLYRVAKNSRVINALINACRNGKKVTVVVELQARFDEKANIYWSQKLEEVGANILFGIKGLKVHSKLVLITRKDRNRIENYAVVSTGNFHEGNASVYTDLALMTSDKRITKEVKRVFEFFETPYRNYSYKHLLVSPLFMRKKFYLLIDNEIANAKAGLPAFIIVKINNLVDTEMVRKLHEANNAGVKIRLIVRGMCNIIPGIPGQSENIEAVSIVDKFLEHSRLIIFCNNNDEIHYLSSADWMTRNLDHRVEVAAPVYDPLIKAELKHIVETALSDNVKARILNETQSNPFKDRKNGTPEIRSQFKLYEYYQQKSNGE